MNNISKLQESFKDQSLFSQALTHKSWVNEHPGVRGSNERMEFLGDAILEFVVSKEIYQRFPQKEEGYLTALRANLVNTKNLSEIAKKLKLGDGLYLSRGEEEGGGRENSSLLADTVEAIIGALFMDSGFESSEGFIKENLLTQISQKVEEPLKDAKSALQEYVQSQGIPTPKYHVVSETGPDHNKKFTIEIIVNSRVVGSGEGKSKSTAEQEAAKHALTKLAPDYTQKL